MLYVDGKIIRPDASYLIGAAPAYWFLIQLFFSWLASRSISEMHEQVVAMY